MIRKLSTQTSLISFHVKRIYRKLKEQAAISMKDTYFFATIIQCLAGCDIIYEILVADVALSITSTKYHSFVIAHTSHNTCIIKAFISQFFASASVCYNFIIATILFRILYFKTSLEKMNQTIVYCHIYAWIGAGLAAIVPLCLDLYTHVIYGYCCIFRNCLVKYLCLWSQIVFYVSFAILLLFYCIYLKYCSKPWPQQDKFQTNVAQLSRKMFYFTLMFVLTWIFPLLDTIIEGFSQESPPNTIIYLHDFSFASMGLCNAIIWGTSGLWNRYKIVVSSGSASDHLISSYTSPVVPSVNNRRFTESCTCTEETAT